MPTIAPSGACACAALAVVVSALWQVASPAGHAEAVPSERGAKPLAASDQKPAPKRRARRSDQEPFDLAVISDLNQGYGSTRYGPEVHAAVQALTDRFATKLVLITGDMVAGQKRGVDAPAMWRGFHRAVTERLENAGILIAPAPGNHDASPGFVSERAEYVRQWADRGSKLEFIDGSRYPLRYSFKFRGGFFLALDATSVGPLSREQHAWVENQLDEAERYELKIVFGHLPLHPVAHGREYEVLNDATLEALFVRHGVSAYVSGHHHAFYPGATPSLLHVAMPCLGSGARSLIGTRRRSRQALVLLHVDEATELSSVKAFAAPDFSTEIARSTLPRRIALGRHLLTRDDLMDRRASPLAVHASAE